MIRLLHIQETIGSGGVERLRLSLSKLLDKDKYELKIICTHTGEGIKEEIEAQGVEVIPLGRFKGIFDFKNHAKVQKIIKEYKPHIIHGAVFEGVTMAAINGFIQRVPVVILEETSDPQNRSWRGNLLMKFFATLANVVVGVSPGVVEYLDKTLSLPKKKVILLNNGVALPRTVSEEEIVAFKNKYGIGSEDIVIGSVGRMLHDENKRFSDLIKAFKIISDVNSHVKLILVGDGPELEKYRELSDELLIADKVIFTGYQSDVALYYHLMDVFALVSAHEAFGLVLAEAMLCKLPVVATRVGGMKYIVEDERTGFLVERYDVKEISKRITDLVNSKELREEYGLNGFDKANREYTEKIYVENLLNLYSKLL